MMTLEDKANRIIRAALLELDAKWRKGTANANFQDEQTLQLLRGRPGIHESDVRMIHDMIEGGTVRVEIGRKGGSMKKD